MTPKTTSTIFLLLTGLLAVLLSVNGDGVISKIKNKLKNGKSPNCKLVTNSPQFATLCRLANGTKAALPEFLGQGADQVCDQDCRCVMGAQRGGQCGTSPVDNKVYCRCDYNTPATISPYLSVCPIFPVITNLCNPSKVPVAGSFLNNLCNSDCVCSHGFKASKKKNICTTKNGVAGNLITYCVCNQATNN